MAFNKKEYDRQYSKNIYQNRKELLMEQQRSRRNKQKEIKLFYKILI